jgi:hypothetical protein
MIEENHIFLLLYYLKYSHRLSDYQVLLNLLYNTADKIFYLSI